MWFMSNKYQVLFVIVLTATYDITRCNAISNTNYNSHLRDFSAVEVNNITNVKTLQKEDIEKIAAFTPVSNPIKFKEIPDSALSSSSNSRGLLYHDQPGYPVNDYEEGSHYSHGHDYHLYDHHPEAHGPPPLEYDHHHSYPHSDHPDYHDPHDHPDYIPGHNHGHHYSGHKHHHSHHGPYNKHYKHALAAKTVLWPIAGIALLGAAAALVSNPILLQLGVVSGKRRRRDTEEVTGPDFPSGAFKKYEDKINEQSNETKDVYHLKEDLRKKSKQNKILKFASLTATTKGRIFKTDNLKNVQNYIGVRKVQSSVKRNIEQVTKSPPNFSGNNDDDDRFIPIPIKIRTPKVTD